MTTQPDNSEHKNWTFIEVGSEQVISDLDLEQWVAEILWRSVTDGNPKASSEQPDDLNDR